MQSYSLTHLADHVLVRDLASLVARDRSTTAALLAHVAEVDERGLYRDAAYPSMFEYCVKQLRMSEDVAAKRIQVARAARKHPAIFPALADGRLHLTAVVLLAPRLTRENAGELIEAATDKTMTEIELLLAARFPQADVPPSLRALATTPVTFEVASVTAGAPVAASSPAQVVANTMSEQVPEPVGMTTSPHPPREPYAKVTPLSPGRAELRCTISGEAQELLRYVQALEGHAVPSGDIGTLLERALRTRAEQLERGRFATTSKPRAGRGSKNPRHIPAAVKREVLERDGGRCSFVSESGHRCESRRQLEFDHVILVAKGGATTAANLRLRCRAHNQFAAERAFGKGFMAAKRQEAKRKAAESKVPKRTVPASPRPAPVATESQLVAALEVGRGFAAVAHCPSRMR